MTTAGDIDRLLLLAVVSTMIPARTTADPMPAASDLPEFQDMPTEEATAIYGPLLERLRLRDAAENTPPFASLDQKARESILREMETEQPGLVHGAVFQTLMRYYGTDAAMRGLGLEPRPPHPNGYQVEETDWGLLDPVRDKKPIYKTLPGEGEES